MSGFQPRTIMCKNKQGEIVGEEKDVLEVCATYFKELLNPKTNMITSEETIYFGPESNIMAPTLQEILGVIRNLKNNYVQQGFWPMRKNVFFWCIFGR
jgi:hypothetical protein